MLKAKATVFDPLELGHVGQGQAAHAHTVGVGAQDGQGVLAEQLHRLHADRLEGVGGRDLLALVVDFALADHGLAHVAADGDVRLAHGSAAGHAGGDALVQEVDVGLDHRDLHGSAADQHHVQAGGHGGTGGAEVHVRADAARVGADQAGLEGAGGVDDFGGELALGVHELAVLVQAYAHGQPVDHLAFAGGPAQDLEGLLGMLHGRRRHLEGLAVGDGGDGFGGGGMAVEDDFRLEGGGQAGDGRDEVREELLHAGPPSWCPRCVDLGWSWDGPGKARAPAAPRRRPPGAGRRWPPGPPGRPPSRTRRERSRRRACWSAR